MHMDPARSPFGWGRRWRARSLPEPRACGTCLRRLCRTPRWRGARSAPLLDESPCRERSCQGGCRGGGRVERVALSERRVGLGLPCLSGRDPARREVRFLWVAPSLGGGAGAWAGIPPRAYLSCVSERDLAQVRGSFLGAILRRRRRSQCQGWSDPGLASHACQRGTSREREVRLGLGRSFAERRGS